MVIFSLNYYVRGQSENTLDRGSSILNITKRPSVLKREVKGAKRINPPYRPSTRIVITLKLFLERISFHSTLLGTTDLIYGELILLAPLSSLGFTILVAVKMFSQILVK